MITYKFPRPALCLSLFFLCSAFASGCTTDRDIVSTANILVAPQDVAQGWLAGDTTIDETVSITIPENVTLVPGVEFIGILDDEVDLFECETILEGTQIRIEITARSRDMTDDNPGSSRRLCPGVGPLPSGTYTVNANGLQSNITVPSVVRGDLLSVS